MLLHWMVVMLVLISFTTGIRIAADSQLLDWATVLEPMALQGSVLLWHLMSACTLVAAGSAYAVYIVRTGQTRRVKIDMKRLHSLSSPDRQKRWFAINIFIYWLAFGLLVSAAITGIAMYVELGPNARPILAVAHFYIAWGFAAYIVIHVLAQVLKSGWRGIFAITVPRFKQFSSIATVVASIGVVAASVFAIDALSIRSLSIALVQSPPIVDGVGNDTAWQNVPAIAIDTSGGANLFDGATTVNVKAVRDEAYAYFLFEWADATRSLKHHPLYKTEAGWKMMQHGYALGDETEYYEDKLAVMLSNSSRFAALRSAHLGPKPVKGMPGAPGRRGLHYTDDGSILDVWHWMAVRTNPLGQLEDDYFGELRLPSDSAMDRYAGGYALDPALSGGFVANWRDLLESPISRRFDSAVIPRFLPQDPALLERLGNVDIDPNVSDEGDWWLPMAQVQAYSAEQDALFPVGTVLPSVVLRQRIEGDRGDVTANGKWSDGHWQLEVKRKLDTGSPYDVKITDNTYLWVAVFDHSQTRHSWHLRPLKIRFSITNLPD